MATGVAVNLGGTCIWTPFKDLNLAVEAALLHRNAAAIPDFEAALRKHKPDFSSLLKNPEKNSHHRDLVSKASKDGINVVGKPTAQVLPSSVVTEAIIISDMFQLNEIVSLELLLAGQQQQPLFPELTRGLVAVLLYYDGRRSLVNSLRTLIQVREGRTWTSGLNPDLVSLVTRYTDKLREEDGLFTKVMDLIENYDLSKELDILQKNKALGGPRYRKQIVDIIQETYQSLAEIIFYWACQTPLSRAETMRIVKYLSTSADILGDGSLTSLSVTVLMALLYVIDVSILQTSEDTDERLKQLPLYASNDLGLALHKEFTNGGLDGKVKGLNSVVLFSWAVTLRTFSQFPLLPLGNDFTPCLEEDERTLDLAIESDAFQKLILLVLHSPLVHKEEFFLKRIHGVVTDFIILMPLKVKELRNQGDEAARIISAYAQEGLGAPSNLPRHFENMLYLISELYSKDPLNLELAQEFWCPTETTEHSYIFKPPQRQVALFKFVRLSGDLLPPSLYVPYITMLTSLSRSKTCAYHCFNLLKNNGRNMGSQGSIVSWDHFFHSLLCYYNSLRQEYPLSVETHYLYRPSARGISPLEIQGLVSVLKLIETVVKQDEIARTTLGENTQHTPIILLISLIGCSVPPELKAAFLRTLAAFAKSPELAMKIWQALESSQIIPTVRSLSTHNVAGIQTDLKEVECRNEEFPITRAMLELLHVLTNHPLPPTYGSTLLKSGLDPYLDYVREMVFMKFNTRPYKQQSEKWEVAKLCLSIFEKLLRQYSSVSEDLCVHLSDAPVVRTSVTESQVAFSILANLLQDGGFLRLILYILDEGVRQFDLYSTYSGQENLEQSTLLCLNIIQSALTQQEFFLQQVRSSNIALIVTSLDQLLMGANPRTGKPDYMVVIAKYITYNLFLQRHALSAARILLLLTRSSKISEHLATAFMSDDKLGRVLMHRFAECLDPDDNIEPTVVSEEKWSDAEVRNVTCQNVLKMLLQCVAYSVPNVGHFLLGFDLKHSIAKTALQEPGVLGFPRTCLHAVLSILDHNLEGKENCSSAMVELSYKLIYVLCANVCTNEPVMRYLRTTRDFFYQHLQKQPLHIKNRKQEVKVLMQQSWFLRCVALELRLTSSQNQRSHIQRLIKLLLEDNPEVLSCPSEASTEFISSSTSQFVNKPVLRQKLTGAVKKKLLKLLDTMNFQHDFPAVPSWEYFDAVELEKAIRDCEYQEADGLVMIDALTLHKRLAEETASLQGLSTIGQKTLIMQEVKNIMQYALLQNQAKQAIFAKKQAFIAWKQVAEVTVTTCPQDIFGGELKMQVVLEIAQELLKRVLEDGTLQEVIAPASGVLLILTAAFHHCLILLLPSAPEVASTEIQSQGKFVSVMTYSSSLLAILKSLLECLMKTGSGLQRIRANYYGALLNLLRIVQKPQELQRKQSIMDRMLTETKSETERLRQSHMEILFSYGEPLMELVCRDLCSGHEVTRMLALSALDVIICLDIHQHWLSFLTSKGYLRHLVDSILKDDIEIQLILTKGSESLRSLYMYESKMALFTRLASSPLGAQALLQNGVVDRLAECQSLDLHPQPGGQMIENSQWLNPPVHKCYQQAYVPAMKFLLALTASVGPKHRDVYTQLNNFIIAHAEMFITVLQQRNLQYTKQILEELALSTGLLSQLDFDDDLEHSEQRSRLKFLHHHVLALLPWFLFVKSNLDVAEQVLKLQVAANVARFCCNLMTPAIYNKKSVKVIFAPVLAENPTSYFSKSFNISVTSSNPPSLSLLVQLIQNFCTEVQFSVDSYHSTLHRLQNLSDLGSVQLEELLPSNLKGQSYSHQKQKELVKQTLLSLSQQRKKELGLLFYIIERMMFMLWKHLEYYLVHCIPYNTSRLRSLEEDSVSVKLDSSNVSRVGSAGGEVRVSSEDLQSLKSSIQSVISESFFCKVQDIEGYMEADQSEDRFLGAIIRRVKRLVKQAR